jgi:hypothetical protein
VTVVQVVLRIYHSVVGLVDYPLHIREETINILVLVVVVAGPQLFL